MEYLPLGRIAALVPEFAVKDLPLGRTLMMMTSSSECSTQEQDIHCKYRILGCSSAEGRSSTANHGRFAR